MSATVRATCPGCKAPLAVPAAMLGRAVKCTACGAVVRTKPKATPPAAARPAPVPVPLPAETTDADPFNLDDPPAPAVVARPLTIPRPDDPFPGPVASEATRAHRRGKPYRPQRGGGRLVGVAVVLLLAGGLAAGAYYSNDLRGWLDRVTAGNAPPADGGREAAGPPADAGRVAFPRRLLFVHVGNYLYLNPLTAAAVSGTNHGPDRAKGQADRLAYELRVPTGKDNNQLFLLADTPDPPHRRPPLKAVLTETVRRFCDTSRPQDRVVLYFGGHVLSHKSDAGETVYLVPIEGDPDDPATLVPLSDIYKLVEGCPATQKVVIWDVCRYNPERGRQRPGSEPMTEPIAAALAAAPPGVQAVLTCGAGENALEFFGHEPDGPNKGVVAGSSFLEAIAAVRKGGKPARPQSPDDPIPVDEWAAALGRRVAEVAKSADGKPTQTVTVAGSAPDELTPFAAGEPTAARFDFPAAAAGADPAAVAAVVKEFALPDIKSDDDPSGVAAFPFPAAALDPYKADAPLAEVLDPKNKEKYAFRQRTAEALELIRTIWSKDGKPQLRESFVGETNDAVKKEVLKEQDAPAGAITRLERAAERLAQVEDQRASQPKRWQAHYDYAVAQTKARIAFLQEYNLALGNIRTEVLPPRDPKLGHDGYKLVAAAGMKERGARKLAEEAQEVFDRMAADYKGTPWGVQARRDRAQSLGLAWQPFNSKAAADKDE